MKRNDSAGVAIVTGASRGLGLGIAQRLAHSGHPVVLVARASDELNRAATSIRELGHVALAVAADVTSEEEVERVAALTHHRFGAPEVLVNNAGALPEVASLDDLTWERFRRGIDVDVRAAFNATRAYAATMRAARRGTIVNLAGAAAGTVSSPLHTGYSPSQAALYSLSRCTASWLAPAGVAVHCLCPSLTPAGGVGDAAATGFGAAEGITSREWIERQMGGVTLTPAEVGDAVVALVEEPDSATWKVSPAGLARWEPAQRRPSRRGRADVPTAAPMPAFEAEEAS
jgi:NAD(P)-dependent dehydrogenase (short-subunit alcohol dehydrogenase family)